MRPDENVPKLDRRRVLRMGAAGAAALAGAGAAGRARASDTCTQSPAQTEGPYWVEEMLNRSDIRSDPATGLLQAGYPLRLMINVSEITAGTCAPAAGCWVDVWHCNALGVYSDVNANGNGNTLGQRWLRGYQVSDAHGNVRFLTVYPGWYAGRTVHIHFRVRKFSGNQATFNFVSQLYFDDAVTNAIYRRTSPYSTRLNRNPATNQADGIYSSAMLVRLADNGTHAVASFKAVINAVSGLAGGPLPEHLARLVTPTDEDSLEHLHDFGGGTPPMLA